MRLVRWNCILCTFNTLLVDTGHVVQRRNAATPQRRNATSSVRML